MAVKLLGMKTDLRKLLKSLDKAGWTVTYTGGGHIKAVPPGSRKGVYMPSTPGDGKRGMANIRAKLRREGFTG